MHFNVIDFDFIWSGQHYSENMKDVFFNQLNVPVPDYEFNIDIKNDATTVSSIINETYTSLVHYYKEKDKILVTNIDGPLTHLKNEWKFKEINDSTQLEFDIDFELKNNLLNAIMKRSFNFGLSKIADAFEKRALELYK